MHISPYEQGNQFNHDPLRSRKLLLHKKQINELVGKSKVEGAAIVPLKMYLKDGYAKVLLGVGKGKKKYDKRNLSSKKPKATLRLLPLCMRSISIGSITTSTDKLMMKNSLGICALKHL